MEPTGSKIMLVSPERSEGLYILIKFVRMSARSKMESMPVGELRLLLQAAAISGKVFRGLNGSDRTLLYATAMGTGFRAGSPWGLPPRAPTDPDVGTVRIGCAAAPPGHPLHAARAPAG